MRNFAEELAYWYFRLNGFFPIPDLLLHRGEITPQFTDCDVLAIRPPHVYEEVGGNSNDWDLKIKQYFDNDRTLGVICEVKGGSYRRDEIFKDHHVRRSLQRLGFFSNGQMDDVKTALLQKNTLICHRSTE